MVPARIAGEKAKSKAIDMTVICFIMFSVLRIVDFQERILMVR